MTQTQKSSHFRWQDGLNVPNAISALRLPLAALFPLLGSVPGRIAVVTLAAGSDWIDGRLARASSQVTRLGELLDPIADKTFMASVLITLAVEGRVPVWTLPLLLTRDIGVALGALVRAARGHRDRMPARRAGKLVTWLQFIGIAALLLWPGTAWWIAAAIAAIGVFALVDYARAISDHA